MGFLSKLNQASERFFAGPTNNSLSPKQQSVGISQISSTKRELDFSKFLEPEMRARKKSGELEWMDLVEVFEGMYMETCEKEGRILKNGNRLSSSTDDRFRVTWEIDGLQIKGEYTFDGRWWIVTETIKNKK
jgi:hypothetical protein